MNAYAEINDQQLVSMIRSGNHAAFAELVHRHTDRFYSLAYRTLQNQSDAEDVVQSAFVKFWERPQLWNPDKALFTTWFYRVVINACHDLMRKSGRTTQADPEFLEARAEKSACEQTGYEQRQTDAWQRQCLESGIKALPSSQRDALNLVVYCGLPQAQAAEVMGVSIKAIESLLVRAKRSLSASVVAMQAAAERNKVSYVER